MTRVEAEAVRLAVSEVEAGFECGGVEAWAMVGGRGVKKARPDPTRTQSLY